MKKIFISVIVTLMYVATVQGQDPSRNASYYKQKVEGSIIRDDYSKEEVTITLKNPIELHDRVTWQSGGSSSVTSTPKSQSLLGFVVNGDLWLKKTVKGKLKFCYIEIDGPISYFRLWKKKTDAVGKMSAASPNAYADTKVYIQKLDEDAVGTNGLLMGFKKKFPPFVNENKEIADKVSSKEKGYGIGKIDAVIKEYNTWYIAEKGYKTTEDKMVVAEAKKAEAKKVEAATVASNPISQEEIKVGTNEELTNYLLNNTWELGSVTSFNSSNPNGVTVSSVQALKNSRRYFTYQFSPSNSLVSVGMHSGRYNQWEVIDAATIDLYTKGSTSKLNCKITKTNSDSFVMERLNPLTKEKEIIILFKMKK